jgi:hypothetical protein
MMKDDIIFGSKPVDITDYDIKDAIGKIDKGSSHPTHCRYLCVSQGQYDAIKTMKEFKEYKNAKGTEARGQILGMNVYVLKGLYDNPTLAARDGGHIKND